MQYEFVNPPNLLEAIFDNEIKRSFVWFKLDRQVEITDSRLLSSAAFYDGDFIWQPEPGQTPQMVRFCHITHFFNRKTHVCEPCPLADTGTYKEGQSSCMSCGSMRDQGVLTGNSSKSLGYAVAH